MWTYLHADALGSVRDLSGVTGNAIGHVDYSPFGEIVNSTGMASWFGFAGEQQDGSTGLTYLRARYYDPALGRFLTPDSLIPDITNGQSLNAYAYVYNDPVNLVDPNGYFGEVPMPFDPMLSDPKEMVYEGALLGLKFIDWWYTTPKDCDCGSNDSPTELNIINQSLQGIISLLTAPDGYNYYATVTGGWDDMINFTKVNYDITKWGKLGPVDDARYVVTNLLDDAYRVTNAGGVASMNVSNITRELPGSLLKNLNPLLMAAFIEGGIQLVTDWSNDCLSPDNKFWRALAALELGLIATLAGFWLAASLPIAATGTLFAVIAVGGSIAVGYAFSDVIKINGKPFRNWLLVLQRDFASGRFICRSNV